MQIVDETWVHRKVLKGMRHLGIHNGWSESIRNELYAQPFESLSLSDSNEWGDFSYLHPFHEKIQRLWVTMSADYSGIMPLTNLRDLSLMAPPKRIGSLDITQFRKLERLDIWWHPKYPVSILALPELKDCRIYDYCWNDLSSLQQESQIELLTLDKPGKLTSLTGISNFPNLRFLAAGPSRQLIDLSELASCPQLQEIRINSPKGVTGVAALSQLKQMRRIGIFAPFLEEVDMTFLAELQDLYHVALKGPVGKIDWTGMFALPKLQHLHICFPREEIDDNFIEADTANNEVESPFRVTKIKGRDAGVRAERISQ